MIQGAELDIDALFEAGARLDEVLFGEGPSRIVVSVSGEDLARLQECASRHSVPCFRLGVVRGERLMMRRGGASVIDLSVTRSGENDTPNREQPALNQSHLRRSDS